MFNNILFVYCLPFWKYVDDLFAQNQRRIMKDVPRFHATSRYRHLSVVKSFVHNTSPCPER